MSSERSGITIRKYSDDGQCFQMRVAPRVFGSDYDYEVVKEAIEQLERKVALHELFNSRYKSVTPGCSAHGCCCPHCLHTHECYGCHSYHCSCIK
jgi:hypothetical protein